MSGSTIFPLVDQIRDTIRVHGLHWAVQYYSRRLPVWECRFFLRVACLGV